MNQDDDFSLFSQAVRGVRRIQDDRADTGKPRADRQQLANRRQNATQRSDTLRVDGLSDQFVIDVGAEDELHWAATGCRMARCASSRPARSPSRAASTCTA